MLSVRISSYGCCSVVVVVVVVVVLLLLLLLLIIIIIIIITIIINCSYTEIFLHSLRLCTKSRSSAGYTLGDFICRLVYIGN